MTKLKLGFYGSMALAVISTIIIASDLAPTAQLKNLSLAPFIACIVYLPDMLDYFAYRFLPHHPWTHHPLSVIYFLPFMAIAQKVALSITFVQWAAVAWITHLVLDAGGEGIPLAWRAVREPHPLRSYLHPVVNHKWVLRLPRSVCNIPEVQKVGCLIGVIWYMILLFMGVTT